MFGTAKSKRKQLDEWETRLIDCIGDGELLLGELGFGQQDLDEIGQLLADTNFLHLREKRRSIEKTIHFISGQWPLTYALYLVLEGIYSYESGDYWDGPGKRLGLPSNQTNRFGRLFLDTLSHYNLPTFEQSGGLTYVTPILLHGGIPNDFLSKFFDFLWQEEKKHHQISLDAASLLQMWRQEAEEYLCYLPKPVRRFLEYGDLVAVDFVERCLELFDTDSQEEAEALIDLPQRVILAFGQWREERGVATRATAPRIRLQKPVLLIAPYATGVMLYLPVQLFPHRLAPRQLIWHFVDSGRQIPCQMRRVEGGIQFEADEQVAVSPAEKYVVQLEADGDHLQTWTLPGLAEPPVLFFDPYDAYEGDALVDQERFRPGERWLLYPQNYSWKEPGKSQKRYKLPMLGGDWRGYNLEAWQLSPGEMVLQDENGRIHPFTIIHEKSRQRPYLSEESRLPLPTLGADFPLYVGRPPALILYTKQPHRWQVAVRAAGLAQPGGHRQKRLSQLPSTSTPDRNGLRLELAVPELLGETPVGKFEVVVRGPLGQSYHFGLRCIPALEIEGLLQLYLANTNEPAQFQFRCEPSVQIRQNPPQAGVELRLTEDKKQQRRYSITAAPNIMQLNLQLRHDCGVILPLTIPIYRLRWGLWSGNDNIPMQWRTEPSAIYPGASPNGMLWVDVPVVRERPLHVGWQLINADNKILRHVAPGELPVQRRLEWPLTEVTAVWREYRETLCWQLIIQQAEQEESLLVPAFYLLPTLDFGEVAFEWRSEGEQVSLTLLWERSQPGNYQLQLWPLDRPWVHEPITRRLPETAEMFTELRLTTAELPPEAYLAELVPYNPWRSARPQRPKPGALNAFLIKPPGLSQYYTEIDRLREQREASIEQLLALLTHQFYNGQQDELYITNKAIADTAGTMTPNWLVRWADATKLCDSIAYKTVQLKLFLPPMLARLSQEQADTEVVARYFSHLPNNFSKQIALSVLQSGLRFNRLECLQILCGLPLSSVENKNAFQVAMAALLDDVADGALAVNRAASLLCLNQQEAVAWLAQDGGLDAKELLQEMAVQMQLEPSWVSPGMLLDTIYGVIEIEKLRHRITNEIRFCAPFDADCYAEGKLSATPTAVPVRLHLLRNLLSFLRSEPYQCQHCKQLFTSLADFSQHHHSIHPGLEQERKRLKQNSSVAWLRPRLATLEQD